mmetsp:Transcript_3504/g.5921  ORF Transcript_3504/g.5921 Transcript_3504/m.5921 type:complete len:312 (+) Transcript_3504:3998-4933(+)
MKIDIWSLPSLDLDVTPSKDICIGKESRVAKGATVNNTSDCHEFNPVLEGINPGGKTRAPLKVDLEAILSDSKLVLIGALECFRNFSSIIRYQVMMLHKLSQYSSFHQLVLWDLQHISNVVSRVIGPHIEKFRKDKTELIAVSTKSTGSSEECVRVLHRAIITLPKKISKFRLFSDQKITDLPIFIGDVSCIKTGPLIHCVELLRRLIECSRHQVVKNMHVGMDTRSIIPEIVKGTACPFVYLFTLPTETLVEFCDQQSCIFLVHTNFTNTHISVESNVHTVIGTPKATNDLPVQRSRWIFSVRITSVKRP